MDPSLFGCASSHRQLMAEPMPRRYLTLFGCIFSSRQIFAHPFPISEPIRSTKSNLLLPPNPSLSISEPINSTKSNLLLPTVPTQIRRRKSDNNSSKVDIKNNKTMATRNNHSIISYQYNKTMATKYKQSSIISI